MSCVGGVKTGVASKPGGLQSMAFCVRFQKINGQRLLVLEFDGRSQTSPNVGWSKMDFSLN